MDRIIIERITQSIQSVLTSELSQITNSLAEINTAITGLRSDYTTLQNSMKDVKDRILEMDKSLTFSDARQDSFDTRLKSLESHTSNINSFPDQLSVLENKLAAFEQQARECNIEISNVPERRGKNLMSIMTALGLAVNFQIQPTNIISLHRVPHAVSKDNRPKNIVAKFTSRILRDNMIAACRAKKGITSEHLSITGSSHKIFVNEHLTLNNKQLFRECRERAKLHQFKYVWIKHGTILARKSDTSPVVAVRT
ncbi:unnamed protein product [Leptidea sinapis]|uniref:FP protein C-terminal domain-containing protein n=1 Tax=Leptidea sinapis TaxID=189913 RepID=A0A5E4QIM3_9NEOP|nr:unnamed protein product [Leptidea sinapis]